MGQISPTCFISLEQTSCGIHVKLTPRTYIIIFYNFHALAPVSCTRRDSLDRLRFRLGDFTTMKLLTFRVRNIPEEYNTNELKKLLEGRLTDEERGTITPLIWLVPSYHADHKTKDALLQFHPKTPTFLHALEKDKTSTTEHQIIVENRVINIDLNFFGLTQVSDPLAKGSVDLE
jgi:hypothetical protein